MPTKFKINDIRRVPSGSPERLGKYDKLVMYETGPMDRHIINIPEEEFSEEAMIRAIKEDIAERGQWAGKEYEFE